MAPRRGPPARSGFRRITIRDQPDETAARKVDAIGVGVLRRASNVRSKGVPFADRAEAGRLLGEAVLESDAYLDSPGALVVVGLARGGVAVAAEVAALLHAPLDALAVRKIGHPYQPEYGIGAVAPRCDPYVRSLDGLTERELAAVVEAARSKAALLDQRLHEAYAPVPVAGATSVLVDDGLATGATMTASVRWARAAGARRVVVAVPVGAAATVAAMEQAADEIVCLETSSEFGAVGLWYRDFPQLSDADVSSLLRHRRQQDARRWEEEIPLAGTLHATDLVMPPAPLGWVLFAHGSGSSRRSPRNVHVAGALNEAGIATVLFDLLTPAEEPSRSNVFDVELLGRRLAEATHWLVGRPEAAGLPVGLFGASTGAAAALLAAADHPDVIDAVVSRGGRPDLAEARLGDVLAPTLLVVGGADELVLELNRRAARRLRCRHELQVVPGATHLFEEPGTLESVCSLATRWFVRYLAAARERLPRGQVPDHLSI